MIQLKILALGAIIGLPFGYMLQRTKLCYNRAYRQFQLEGNATLLRMIVVATLTHMLLLALLIQFGIGGVRVNVVPFFWLAAIVGGFFFGVSMVYAQGCSSTVWYRVGNGHMGAATVLLGFALGEVAVREGFLVPLREWFEGFEITLSSGAPATIPNSLGINLWWVVLPLVAGGLVILARIPGERYEGNWDWRWGGVVLGVIGALAWPIAWGTGWEYGIGIVGATGNIVLSFVRGPEVLNWGSFVVLSMPVGSLIAAIQHKEFRWRIPGGMEALRRVLAGFTMGVSATIAGGCNIGHGFSGLPVLALSSIVATLFTFLGAWLANQMRYVHPLRLASQSTQ